MPTKNTLHHFSVIQRYYHRRVAVGLARQSCQSIRPHLSLSQDTRLLDQLSQSTAWITPGKYSSSRQTGFCRQNGQQLSPSLLQPVYIHIRAAQQGKRTFQWLFLFHPCALSWLFVLVIGGPYSAALIELACFVSSCLLKIVTYVPFSHRNFMSCMSLHV